IYTTIFLGKVHQFAGRRVNPRPGSELVADKPDKFFSGKCVYFFDHADESDGQGRPLHRIRLSTFAPLPDAPLLLCFGSSLFAPCSLPSPL
ncbi:MAG TPA: hypothetical protein PLG17_11675, partial [Thermodesulfobacteriota bacterium]|nr:hypothetical protein [Thermodesulfobacteriota bacterium]